MEFLPHEQHGDNTDLAIDYFLAASDLFDMSVIPATEKIPSLLPPGPKTNSPAINHEEMFLERALQFPLFEDLVSEVSDDWSERTPFKAMKKGRRVFEFSKMFYLRSDPSKYVLITAPWCKKTAFPPRHGRLWKPMRRFHVNSKARFTNSKNPAIQKLWADYIPHEAKVDGRLLMKFLKHLSIFEFTNNEMSTIVF